ncbi:MAG: hypothetical protein RID42_13630 [Alphaproteobacteria bacterium]
MTDSFWIMLGAIPLGIALLSIGLLRFAAGKDLGGRIASTGTGIGLLAAYALVRPSAPLFEDRVALLLVVFLMAGVLGDLLFGKIKILVQTMTIVSPLLALAWLASGVLESASTGTMVAFGLSFAAIAGIGFSLSSADPARTGTTILVAMAGLGIGLVLLLGGDRVTANIALGAAAVALGFFLWNWPVPRFLAGAGLLVGVAGPLLALAAAAAIDGSANRLGLALVALVFFADKMFRLPATGGRIGRATEPLLLAAVSAIVVLAAIAATTFIAL